LQSARVSYAILDCARSGFGRYSGTHDCRDIFCPRPAPGFLDSAMQDARQARAAISVKDASTLGAIKAGG
jgi:hypothetical protein